MSSKNKRLPVAQHLTDSEYKYLLETYAAHNSSMNFEMRKNYSADKIVKIARGNDCLIVYYEGGDYWHYTPSQNWY